MVCRKLHLHGHGLLRSVVDISVIILSAVRKGHRRVRNLFPDGISVRLVRQEILLRENNASVCLILRGCNHHSPGVHQFKFKLPGRQGISQQDFIDPEFHGCGRYREIDIQLILHRKIQTGMVRTLIVRIDHTCDVQMGRRKDCIGYIQITFP